MLRLIVSVLLPLLLTACASNEVSIHEPNARFTFKNDSTIDPIINSYSDTECKMEQGIDLPQDQRSTAVTQDFATRIKPGGRWTGRIKANQPYIFRVLATKDRADLNSKHCGILLKIAAKPDEHYHLTFSYTPILNNCDMKLARVDENGNFIPLDQSSYVATRLPYTQGVCQ